jgi:uncharacterized protein (DUF362 family)
MAAGRSHTGSALLVKAFTVANGVLDNDGLISLSKLKTHGLSRMTGAVKKQFGCIPGLIKGQFHVKLPDPYDFCTMLVDINTFIRPRLYIMDGIMAMEGNGHEEGSEENERTLVFYGPHCIGCYSLPHDQFES